MNNEKLKKQLRDMCIAADSLATAMHLFYANVSSDILDDIIAQAERENSQQENYDRWMDMKRTIETLCGPVNLVNQDKVSKEELGEMIHHCGQDAGSPCGCSAVAYDPNESQPVDLDDACCQVREHQPAGYAYKDLLGMEVMFVFPRCHKCEYCTFREGHNGSECPCVKVELVGGDYLCLAKRPKQKQTIISFDEEEGNMMDDIKEKTEAFMNYLDSVVKD